MSLRAEISLAGADANSLGEPRVALLEAIAREGSIAAAARGTGLSYRAAWDAIRAMNNLTGRPLVEGQTGGKGGGGARLTPEGERLVARFRRLQAEMTRLFAALGPDLGPDLDPDPEAGAARLVFGGIARTSARNALRGEILTTRAGPVHAEAVLGLAEGLTLTVALTRHSLGALGLAPGRAAIALIKAPLVTLSPRDAPPLPGNRIAGRVAQIARDGRAAEVTLDIGGGKSLCATLPVGALAFAEGEEAVATIDPNHIILAVE